VGADPPGSGTADGDLFWHLRLSRELAERDSQHQAETERLIAVLLDVLSDLDGLLALGDVNAARYRRGTEIVLRRLAAALREASVELIGVPGEPLDPAIHCVIGTTESPGTPPEHVTQVLRHGYQYRGRITPADVMVSAAPDADSPAARGQSVGNQPGTDEEQE